MAANSDYASDCVRGATATEPQRQDFYYWRLVMTGACFVAFGLGALIVGVVLLPLVRIIPAARARRRDRARAVVTAALRFFVGVMHRVGVMTYEFRGVARLGRPGQLIVANHPTLIDVVFLLGFTPAAGCVAKEAMWRNPLTCWAVTLAEYITNDPTATMIETAADALRGSQTLVMFPEGTRTTSHAPLVFHRGAANVALRAAACLTPVYIRCEPTTLTKAEPWYRIPPRRPHFTLEVGPDIDLARYRGALLPVASRELNRQLQAQFEREPSGALYAVQRAN